MNIRYLTVGSTFLPSIIVEQVLFSAGDVHAEQGDGEVRDPASNAMPPSASEP